MTVENLDRTVNTKTVPARVRFEKIQRLDIDTLKGIRNLKDAGKFVGWSNEEAVTAEIAKRQDRFDKNRA
jgi:hypothetical protein